MGLDPAFVCLDQQLLHFMDQLEILKEKRERLNLLIEEGWFNISKARYSMGNKQVSALQYASQMEPLIHVHISLPEEGEVEFTCERRDQNVEELKESATVETIGPTEGGLRRRINVRQKGIKEEALKDGCEDEPQHIINNEKLPCHHQDPLKWFGILVPQNLKQAQAAFKEVITIAAEISSLQSAILNIRKEMQAQLKKKQNVPELKE